MSDTRNAHTQDLGLPRTTRAQELKKINACQIRHNGKFECLENGYLRTFMHKTRACARFLDLDVIGQVPRVKCKHDQDHKSDDDRWFVKHVLMESVSVQSIDISERARKTRAARG